MTNSDILYDFPKNSTQPYDINNSANYFVYANQFSNLAATLSELSIEVLRENIPMGYKTIIINRRSLIIEQGHLIKEWEPGVAKSEDDAKFVIYSEIPFEKYFQDWDRNVSSHIIRKPESRTADMKTAVWKDQEECLEYATGFSKTNTGKILISKVVEIISWH